MSRRPQSVFGVETEYAVAAFGLDGRKIDRESTAWRIMETARGLPHVPALGETGIFLSTGGRLYVDTGFTIEHATPECSDPREVVRYVAAGELILAHLARQLSREDPSFARVEVFRNSVDYVAPVSTRGCHESILTKTHPSEIHGALVSHLVSRVVFTGAGGLDPWTGRFVISPRALVTTHVVRAQDQGRGLFDRKEQPLAETGFRLHITCGEANLSQLSTYLKIGTTALVALLGERGCLTRPDLQLARPIAALHAIVQDPTLRRTVTLRSGERLTALGLQRRILDAMGSADPNSLPEWSDQILRAWRETLERLETGRSADGQAIDWVLKREVLARAAVKIREARRGQRLPFDAHGGGPWTDRWMHGLGPELAELDLHFGQVGSEGTFTRFDAADAVGHRVVEVDQILRAQIEPPGSGRACLRGRAIRELWLRGANAGADWSGVLDLTGHRCLNLPDALEGSNEAPLHWRNLGVALEGDDGIPF